MWEFLGVASPSRRAIGDHPPTLPATIPAMAAAGANAEFDRDLPVRRVLGLRESEVAGAWPTLMLLALGSPPGVWALELRRDLDPLLECVMRVSRGCCNLYLRAWRRPPRSIFKTLSSFRISSRAAFHSSGESSSETMNWGDGFFLLK